MSLTELPREEPTGRDLLTIEIDPFPKQKRMLCADLPVVMRTQLVLHLQEAIESRDEVGEATIRKALGLVARLRECLDGIALLPK